MKRSVAYIIFCSVVLAHLLSWAGEIQKPDSIDWLVAKLVSSGGWESGIVSSVHLPESAVAERIVSSAFSLSWEFKGHAIGKVVEIRQVQFPHISKVYQAALVETDAGRKIVLFTYQRGNIGWWFRIYDAPDSAPFTGGCEQIWYWLDFPYARSPDQCLAFVEIVNLAEEPAWFTNSPNSQVSDDDGKTWA